VAVSFLLFVCRRIRLDRRASARWVAPRPAIAIGVGPECRGAGAQGESGGCEEAGQPRRCVTAGLHARARLDVCPDTGRAGGIEAVRRRLERDGRERRTPKRGDVFDVAEAISVRRDSEEAAADEERMRCLLDYLETDERSTEATQSGAARFASMRPGARDLDEGVADDAFLSGGRRAASPLGTGRGASR